MFLTCVVGRWDINAENNLLQIIKTFLYFEADVMKDLPKPQLTLGVKVVKILVILCEVTVITIPMLQFALLTYAPCTSPFILSMLPKCRQITKSSHWLENSVIVLIHIFESWMCFHMMLAGTAGIIFVFFVGMVCLLGYLRILEREIAEIGNIHDVASCVQLYHKISVLEKSINAVLMERILPCFILCVPVVEIVSIFVCISFHDDIAMPGFVMFPILGLDAILATTICLTLASKVHNVSKMLARRLRSAEIMVRNRDMTMSREIKALSPLKIKFGSNFVDRRTPLVIQNFCVTKTMTLSIIRAKWKK
ncbi:hypothetical protein Fcan01_16002 [Folsomia candida]|uniref:Uncharacterized protein n=1 Tax=Folsomia candida TaxID=158441 RepID=A0A226DX51_FOLCA|nr:hypothetical protein Fcan01_16002 [Folsomia candida]